MWLGRAHVGEFLQLCIHVCSLLHPSVKLQKSHNQGEMPVGSRMHAQELGGS